MCLAIPAQVVQLRDDHQAVIDLGGVRKEISVALVPDCAVGDYVIVHVGYAIGKVDAAEAERTLALFAGLAAESASEVRGNPIPTPAPPLEGEGRFVPMRGRE
jgi:hydrogenase expression/formation protein HypC